MIGWKPAEPGSDEHPRVAGWIDVPMCEQVLAEPLSILACLDGSAPSIAGFTYLADDMLQRERSMTIEVLHIYSDDKDYLPPSHRKDAIYAFAESKLISSARPDRYKLVWKPRAAKVGAMISQIIDDSKPNFVCMGFYGRKGKKDRNECNRFLLGSNLYDVLCHGRCGAIVIKDQDPGRLPVKRPAKFVVSVHLNKAATKGFLDALRLSKPGDEIHVVYVRVGRIDGCDYSLTLREKYDAFFSGLEAGKDSVWRHLHDRQTGFHMVDVQGWQTVSQAILAYADDIDADFIVVGSNSLRMDRGKSPMGSVAMQLCMASDRNLIVSNWAQHEESVRRPSLA